LEHDEREQFLAGINLILAGISTVRQALSDTPSTLRQWCEDTLKPTVQAA
jgi:hypothetical protein